MDDQTRLIEKVTEQMKTDTNPSKLKNVESKRLKSKSD